MITLVTIVVAFTTVLTTVAIAFYALDRLYANPMDSVEEGFEAQHKARVASKECGLSNTAESMRELGISEEVINELNN